MMWCYVIFNNDHALSVTRHELVAQALVNDLKHKQHDTRCHYHYRKVEYLDDGR